MISALFIYEFLKHPHEIGTFTPSTKFLAKEIAYQINGSVNIIEFGPGIGPVTLEILKQLPEEGHLVCFETNPSFCKSLQGMDDSRLKVVNDDAGNCEQYIDSLECIVSGLPLMLFAKSKRDKILDIASKSRRYIQLQYTPLMTKELRNYFSDVKMKFMPFNFPPAFIYVCSAFEK